MPVPKSYDVAINDLAMHHWVLTKASVMYPKQVLTKDLQLLAITQGIAFIKQWSAAMISKECYVLL